MSVTERWTIHVCPECGGVGRFKNTFHMTQHCSMPDGVPVEVVPSTTYRGAIERLRALHAAAAAARNRSYVDVPTVRAFVVELEATDAFLRGQ